MDGTPEDHHGSERFETVIIGGGQAGLSTGYHLAARDRPFVILDANERIGDAWRTRWDSLRLFTPARYDGLEGLHFPARPVVPDEGRDGRLPRGIHEAIRAPRPHRDARRRIVPARGAVRHPRRQPAVRGRARRGRDGRTQRAHDPLLRRRSRPGHRATAFARLPGSVPTAGGWRLGRGGRELGRRDRVRGRPDASDVGGRHALRPDPRPSWSRRRAIRVPHRAIRRPPRPDARDADRPEARPQARVGCRPPHPRELKDLAAAGVEQVARTAGTRDGLPVLEDGRVLEASNVIWCTGFHYDFGWIDVPVIGEHGAPVHRRGVAEGEPGLPSWAWSSSTPCPRTSSPV
jgi:putative flavoprotein involved in K+ transport